MQDKTVQVPGGDGTYYFGTYFTQKPLSISFAFDNLTEKQIEEIRAWLGDKKIHNLVFDERPYKAYRAKVTGTSTIKYIPFNEGEERERVYKGEGSI
jgi:predicted phage tail component-like protein